MKIIKLKVQRDVCNSWCPLTVAREQEVLVLLLTVKMRDKSVDLYRSKRICIGTRTGWRSLTHINS